MTERPPLGIPPKWITEEFRKQVTDPFQVLLFDFKRFLAIRAAIKRYYDAGYPCSQEWAFEDAIIRYSRLYHSMHQQ